VTRYGGSSGSGRRQIWVESCRLSSSQAARPRYLWAADPAFRIKDIIVNSVQSQGQPVRAAREAPPTRQVKHPDRVGHAGNLDVVREGLHELPLSCSPGVARSRNAATPRTSVIQKPILRRLSGWCLRRGAASPRVGIQPGLTHRLSHGPPTAESPRCARDTSPPCAERPPPRRSEQSSPRSSASTHPAASAESRQACSYPTRSPP